MSEVQYVLGRRTGFVFGHDNLKLLAMAFRTRDYGLSGGEIRGGTPGRMSMASRGGSTFARSTNSARCGRRRFCCLRTRAGR